MRTKEDKFANLGILRIFIIPFIKINNSQILDFVKNPEITNSRKFKHEKMTRSTVGP